MTKTMVPGLVNSTAAIDSAAAAKILGVSKSHLEKLRLEDQENSPPYFRVGRSVRYWPEHLCRWIEEQISD